MRKFSKINESIRIDSDKVDNLVKEIEGIEYKIHEYYYHHSKNSERFDIFQDVKDLKDDDNYYAKLIFIKPKLSYTSGSIDNYYKDLKFQSSGFYFSDITSIPLVQKILGLMEGLKEHSPKLCIKDEKFLILIVGDKVDDSELSLKNDIIKAYGKLYQLLDDSSTIKNNKKLSVSFWRQYNELSIVIDSKLTRQNDKDYNIFLSILASLSPNIDEDWIRKSEKIKEIEDISEEIHDMGFNIKLVFDKSYSVKLIIYEY